MKASMADAKSGEVWLRGIRRRAGALKLPPARMGYLHLISKRDEAQKLTKSVSTAVLVVSWVSPNTMA